MENKFYGLTEKLYNQLSDDERERARRFHESAQKIEALQDRIMEECRKQGFTIEQVFKLAGRLKSASDYRAAEIWGQLF